MQTIFSTIGAEIQCLENYDTFIDFAITKKDLRQGSVKLCERSQGMDHSRHNLLSGYSQI